MGVALFNMKILLPLVVSLIIVTGFVKGAWKNDDKVLLKDVSVLTLYSGKMTTGRRSAPVKQMQCVGGSADCHSYVPQVVQCYNRGSDGVDVQWECKADMDNAYRFGQVEVICEGYDYPDDPYILKGSCGLEYTLELTKEGHQQQHQGSQYNSYGDSHHDSGYGYSNKYNKKSSWMGDTVMLVIVGVIIYAVYRTCIAGPDHNPSDWQDGNDPNRRSQPPRSGPPPPGFRGEYMPDNDDGNCHSTRSSGYTHTGTNNHSTNTGSGGGFWTGAATGGLLGYLFGSRTNTYSRPYGSPYGRGGWGSGSGWGSGWGTGSGWGSGWGSGTRTTYRSGGGGGFGGGFGGSSGTRTASGFGGTRRR